MISKKSKVTKKKNYLVMDYISRPHLVNNFKYDLRVYVLISGFFTNNNLGLIHYVSISTTKVLSVSLRRHILSLRRT
jgi:hypothetical protein